METDTKELTYNLKISTDIEEVMELISAYRDYIELLGDELNDLIPLASVRGWKSKRVEIGEVARKRIVDALAKFNEHTGEA